MRFKNIIIALFSGLVIVVIASNILKWKPGSVNIDVAMDSNFQLILSITNTTPHVILGDNPRVSGTTRLDWTLTAGLEIIAQEGQIKIVRNPLLVGHSATGPFDIGPGRPFICNLNNYYPEFNNHEIMGKAKSFLWSCRVWDATADNWILSNGIVPVN